MLLKSVMSVLPVLPPCYLPLLWKLGVIPVLPVLPPCYGSWEVFLYCLYCHPVMEVGRYPSLPPLPLMSPPLILPHPPPPSPPLPPFPYPPPSPLHPPSLSQSMPLPGSLGSAPLLLLSPSPLPSPVPPPLPLPRLQAPSALLLPCMHFPKPPLLLLQVPLALPPLSHRWAMHALP